MFKKILSSSWSSMAMTMTMVCPCVLLSCMEGWSVLRPAAVGVVIMVLQGQERKKRRHVLGYM